MLTPLTWKQTFGYGSVTVNRFSDIVINLSTLSVPKFTYESALIIGNTTTSSCVPQAVFLITPTCNGISIRIERYTEYPNPYALTIGQVLHQFVHHIHTKATCNCKFGVIWWILYFIDTTFTESCFRTFKQAQFCVVWCIQRVVKGNLRS